MKRIFTLVFGTLLAAAPLCAQPTGWEKTFETVHDDDRAEEVLEKPNGHLLIGASRHFGSGADFQLMETTPAGDTIWTRRYGGPGDDMLLSMTFMPNGHILMAGMSSTPPTKGSYDAMLVCVDAAGGLVWQRKYGGAQLDDFRQVIADNNGITACGVTYSFGAAGGDAWLLHTSLTGDSLWSNRYGGSKYDDAWDLLATPDGGYVFTGGTYSFAAGRFDDAWLVRTDATGNLRWRKTYGLTDKVDWAWNMEPAFGPGGVLQGYVFAGIKDTEENLPGYASAKIHFFKTDTAGNLLWDKSIAPPKTNMRFEGMDLKVGQGGEIYLAACRDSVDRRGLYLCRTSPAGDIIWDTLRAFEEHYYDARSLTLTANGDCVVAGSKYSLIPAYRTDMFVTRFSRPGPPLNVPAGQAAKSLRIFPNPASGTVTVSHDPAVHLLRASLLDITGTVIRAWDASAFTNGSTHRLSLPETSPGAKLLRLQTSAGPVVRPLVIAP